ncbi:MAG: DNA alkylation repair protein, partial [Bacilli bacterium]|nr:DNA alkylation repair protein [Bacilli bacterium]
LRTIAKSILKGNYQSFLKVSSTTYFEEIMLQGLIISSIKVLNELMPYFYHYIELIDNWALNDTFCNSLKIVNKNKTYFLNIIDDLIKSKKEYHVRVGLILLLSYYVEVEYLNLIFKYIELSASEYYYVNMARAWLLCEVFTKYESATLNYLEHHNLDKFTINKAISKIRDSYRVNKEMKAHILKFKRGA